MTADLLLAFSSGGLGLVLTNWFLPVLLRLTPPTLPIRPDVGLDARVFRPAMAMFTANDAVLPFPLRQALDRTDAQLDLLIYEAFPLQKAG